MIIILPLAPICAAVVLLSLSLADGLLGMLSTIRNTVMMIEIVIAAIILVSNIKALHSRTVSGKQVLLNSISGMVSIFATYLFFGGLASDGGAIEGTLNLVIVSLFVGPIWFSMIGGWWGTCAAEDNGEMWKNFLITLGCASVMFYLTYM